MTTRRVRIYRNPDNGHWKVEPPPFGFGSPVPREFPDWQSALHWADQRIPRNSSLAAFHERAGERTGDIVGTSRAWTQPYWQQ